MLIKLGLIQDLCILSFASKNSGLNYKLASN